jgi:group II intron reverse transcriptase/maturase
LSQKEERKMPRRRLKEEERILPLRAKLYHKAKQGKQYQFYTLLDKLVSEDFLWAAWKRVRRNGGAAGVDGVTIKQVEAEGIEGLLKQLREEIQEGRYKPLPVRLKLIDKPNGGKRRLGIPAVRDRIVQTSCNYLLEAIFEADFEEVSHGFRPKRSCKTAIEAVRKHIEAGYEEVLDADLSQYFDTIPHKELMEKVGGRISDGSILRLIRMWLKVPIAEEDGKGGWKYSGGKKKKCGTPQGGVISPILSNIYLHDFDRMFREGSPELRRCGAKVVRYADDFVVMARYMTARVRREVRRIIEDELKLAMNFEKTRIVRLRKGDELNFLSYRIRYCNDLYKRNKKYLRVEPTSTSIKKVIAKIREALRKCLARPVKEMVERLNRIIRGWANYFKGARVYYRLAFRKVKYYLFCRISRTFRRKSQRKSKLYGKGAYQRLLNNGLIDLEKLRYPVNAS